MTLEWLFPWRRLQRIERELDAAERVAVWRMKVEWWENERRRLLTEFHKPSLFLRLIGK